MHVIEWNRSCNILYIRNRICLYTRTRACAYTYIYTYTYVICTLYISINTHIHRYTYYMQYTLYKRALITRIIFSLKKSITSTGAAAAQFVCVHNVVISYHCSIVDRAQKCFQYRGKFTLHIHIIMRECNLFTNCQLCARTFTTNRQRRVASVAVEPVLIFYENLHLKIIP